MERDLDETVIALRYSVVASTCTYMACWMRRPWLFMCKEAMVGLFVRRRQVGITLLLL